METTLVGSYPVPDCEVEADVVQVDEANLPGRPEDAELAAAVINRILDSVAAKPAVHVCLGNYGGQSVQAGTFAALRPFFVRLRADHWVLETARTGLDQLAGLAELEGSCFGVGVIDVKDMVIESRETVARRIEEAARILGGADRIAYVHPDCGLWMLPRSVADGKIRSLVQGRDLFLGRPSRHSQAQDVSGST